MKFGGGNKTTQDTGTNTEISSETQMTNSEVVDGISVPNLAGFTFDEAKAELNKLGLGIDKASETVASDEYEEGQIVSQTPLADEKVEAHTTVTVTLSSGISKMQIPDVTGKEEKEAYNTLVEMGLHPVKEYDYSDTSSYYLHIFIRWIGEEREYVKT